MPTARERREEAARRQAEPTTAQKNASNDRRNGRPPDHETNPLSPAERRLVDRAAERAAGGDAR